MDNVDGRCGAPFHLPKQFQIVINARGIQFDEPSPRLTNDSPKQTSAAGCLVYGAWT
jgi:hypothetical protein